jgi:hypothetical protein
MIVSFLLIECLINSPDAWVVTGVPEVGWVPGR